MRFFTKYFIIFSAITVLFNSCKNDLNILAPYKETVSVYAILNPKETRQYVRINRIFLGEGNAYVMATVNDSVNYKQGVLQVTLTRFVNGNQDLTTMGNPTKTEIILNDTVIQLNSGPFNSNQRLWFTNDKIYPSGEYHLKIRNTVTGNEFTSKSLMIDSIAATGIIQPLGTPYYPVVASPTTPAYAYVNLSNPTIPRKVIFTTLKNARDYSCIIRLHYVDYLTTGDSIKQTLDYEFSRLSSTTLDGGEPMEFDYTASSYFNYVYSKIIAQGNLSAFLKRRAEYIEYIVTAATQDFADFIKISAPSTSVAQDKPTYSNIDGGGYGIFSCRSTFKAPKHLAVETLDYIASKKPMCDLLFLN